MTYRPSRAVCALALAILVVPGLFAFSFEPITQDFSPSGEGSSHVFRVVNTTEERIAVRVSIRPRRIEPNGAEIQGKESDEFVIYPRQMLLDPGARRSVRVAWRGSDSPSAELSYRIIAEQLPVNTGETPTTQGGGIVLTYRYEGSIYVVPPEARPDISLTTIGPSFLEGEPALGITIENTGTRHGLLSNAVVEIATDPGGEAQLVLGPVDLPGLTGENMLAGSTRDFYIPIPDDLPEGPLYGRLTIDEE